MDGWMGGHAHVAYEFVAGGGFLFVGGGFFVRIGDLVLFEAGIALADDSLDGREFACFVCDTHAGIVCLCVK